MRKVVSNITLTTMASLVISSCGDGKVSPPDHLADAYAEILLASALNRGDTIGHQRIVDSIATKFGFESEKKVRSEIHEMTSDPEVLRKVLDSAQNRLESLKQGKNEKGPM
jgi:hypothetical protein